jgi:hypothetical protein
MRSFRNIRKLGLVAGKQVIVCYNKGINPRQDFILWLPIVLNPRKNGVMRRMPDRLLGGRSSRINFNKAGEENLAVFFEKDTVKFAGLKLVWMY